MNTGVPIEELEEVAAAAEKHVVPTYDDHVAAVKPRVVLACDEHVVPTYDDGGVPTYDDAVVPAPGAGAAAMARARRLSQDRSASPRTGPRGSGAGANHRAALLGVASSALANRAASLGVASSALANRAARLGLARVPVDAAVTPTTADPTGKTEQLA